MKFTPQILEIFGGIDLSTDEGVAQAYEEGFNGNYLLIETLYKDDYSLCNENGYFKMNVLREAVKKNIKIFVKSRRGRLWEIAAKAICDSIVGYVILDKVGVGTDFKTNRAFKDKAISLGFVEEPSSEDENSRSLKAMALVGAMALNVLERFMLSVAIYLNQFNKERVAQEIELREVETEEEKLRLLSFVTESYTNEEIDNFEKAVLSTFETFLNSYQLTTFRALKETSVNDYLSEWREAVKDNVSHLSELLLLTTLQEIAAEEDKAPEERKYNEKQAAFVVKYVELQYPNTEC